MLRAISVLHKSLNPVTPLKQRTFSVQNMIKSPQTVEVRIPVPCGTIAAKWWGPKDVRPIVSVHGWQDNSGTFDRLIPLLPDHMSFLAIDLPGHGLSSRYQAGTAYHTVDNVHVLESIRQRYNWDQISLLGHSRGAVINYAYSAFFPDKVNLNVAIDPIKPFIGYPAEVAIRMAKRIPKFLEADAYNAQSTEPPSYTYEALIEHLHIGTGKSVSKEAAPYLLKRNMAESKLHPGKYYFTRDNRLKHLFQVGLGWSPEVCLELAKRLTMPHLCFKMNRSDDWVYYGGDFYREYFKVVGSGNADFEGHFLDGSHHVHLSEPEKVAPMIARFLEKHWKKLPTSEIVGENSKEIVIPAFI
ncbi:probable serine hydrolase [Culex quinquefasciatus]|uniref:probable serine hydrolase n=1 Tax=Culex quinquefasciatus TaxID=7176 RepID=UPI0018E32ED1|nr:probable serine hydrolase [Culex quinquefasciatus]